MEDLQIQLAINHAPEVVFAALTEAKKLMAWFAEGAEVDLAGRRLAFWGRYSPETPTRAQGWHPILQLEAGQQLVFEWLFSGAKTAVSLTLIPRANHTILKLVHSDLDGHNPKIQVPLEDFWLLSLENLRRFLDGRSVTRFDFSHITVGDITVEIDIDAAAETVFDVLTNPAQLKRWIASEAEVELRENGRFDIGWGEGGPDRILELIPSEKISYSWSPWGPDPYETVTTWTLAASGGKTRLTLVHSGFLPERNNDDLQAGWLNFLGWVRSIAEYGDSWTPPVKRLKPEQYQYYPASFLLAQQDLI